MVTKASVSGIDRINGAAALPAQLRGAVVAIGNFDGVHRGHMHVLGEALRIARQEGRPALALTFEPHPRSFFSNQKLFRLTPAPLRARLLQATGFDAVVEQPFDADFAAHDPEAFVAGILVEAMGAAHIVAGHDFHFGRGRAGTPEFLCAAGERLGFSVTLMPALLDVVGNVVSSTRIRQALAEGHAREANGLLGYRYSVEAPVIAGKQLGRTLGFPTANMRLPIENDLRHGIYAVMLRVAGGSPMPGVASFGVRPTVEGAGEPLLETFVFDWSGDLYGQHCTVSLFEFLRPEMAFSGLDTLKVQMREDETQARAVLASAAPLSPLDRDFVFVGGG